MFVWVVTTVVVALAVVVVVAVMLIMASTFIELLTVVVVVAVRVETVCVANLVLTVEVIVRNTVLVFDTGVTARKHAEVTMLVGYLHSIDGRLIVRLLKAAGASATVEVTTTVVGMLNIVVEVLV